MAHELDMTTGRAAIAYRAEGGRPWHGMGEIILPEDDLTTVMQKSGLDWSVLRVPSMYEFNGKLVVAPNAFHQVRSDNGASLSVMSRLFQAHQPLGIVEFIQQLVAVDPRLSIETLGALKGGRVIWCLAKVEMGLTVAGDKHVLYLLITTSFDGSLATRIVATAVRVVCNNTLTGALWAADREKAYVSVRHNVDFSRADVRADALERFATVISEFDQYKALGEALACHRLADHQIEGLFRRLTTDKAARGDAEKEIAPTGRARAAFERLCQSLRDTLQEGTPRGTAWTALNAVTRYVDHARTVRDTEGDGKEGAKFASSLLGSGAALKREAIEVLAELADFQLAA